MILSILTQLLKKTNFMTDLQISRQNLQNCNDVYIANNAYPSEQ
jgi:hypothetical protein